MNTTIVKLIYIIICTCTYPCKLGSMHTLYIPVLGLGDSEDKGVGVNSCSIETSTTAKMALKQVYTDYNTS